MKRLIAGLAVFLMAMVVLMVFTSPAPTASPPQQLTIVAMAPDIGAPIGVASETTAQYCIEPFAVLAETVTLAAENPGQPTAVTLVALGDATTGDNVYALVASEESKASTRELAMAPGVDYPLIKPPTVSASSVTIDTDEHAVMRGHPLIVQKGTVVVASDQTAELQRANRVAYKPTSYLVLRA